MYMFARPYLSPGHMFPKNRMSSARLFESFIAGRRPLPLCPALRCMGAGEQQQQQQQLGPDYIYTTTRNE